MMPIVRRMAVLSAIYKNTMPPHMPTTTNGIKRTSDLTDTLPRYAQIALQSAQIAISSVSPEA